MTDTHTSPVRRRLQKICTYIYFGLSFSPVYRRVSQSEIFDILIFFSLYRSPCTVYH